MGGRKEEKEPPIGNPLSSIPHAHTEWLHTVLLTAATARMHSWVAQDVAVKTHADALLGSHLLDLAQRKWNTEHLLSAALTSWPFFL